MRRYPRLSLTGPVLLLCSLVILAVTLGSRAQAQQPQQISDPASVREDPIARAGFDFYYSLEYDKAIKEFERDVQTHPGDPFAVNHLLNAELFGALYRAGALDTSLYSNNNFLSKKTAVPIDPATKQRIIQLTNEALRDSEQRLKANPNDVDALYAHGTTLSLRATYIGLVDRAWYSALRSALGARHDNEKVLELAPEYNDAKTVVGVHLYVLGSLPWPIKIAASMVGVSGNRQKGLQYLREAWQSHGETSTDAGVALALFLRREQKYSDALAIVRSLIEEHPRNFLFGLEEANLLNASGRGPEAIAAYQRVLAAGKTGTYPDAHLELAEFGLGEALRGQRRYEEAAQAYDSISTFSHRDPELLQRAELAAGQMYDVLGKRDLATGRYQSVVSANSTTAEADAARRYLKQPYRGT